MKKTVSDFLSRHKISPDAVDMEQICSHILNEMEKGLVGKPSSLPMIDSFCKPIKKVPKGENVIVIDAGGTNFRTCLVHFDREGKPVIEDFKKSIMPGSDAEVSAKEFFSRIADETERLIDKSDRIGFCFSYAAQILPDHDGVPMFFSKEIKAPQVIKKHLGKELLKELRKRGHNVENKKIIVMNDTVTTLLAGLSEMERMGCSACIGFILGTGTNTACQMNDTIINEESGNLLISLGDIDEEFLKNTDNPTHYHFEKMISGAYLGPLALTVLRTAAEEGLFSEGFCNQLAAMNSLRTSELSVFLAKEPSVLDACISSEEDAVTLNDILKAFIERVGKLTAANLAASVLASEGNKKKPVLINADGTTFYKTAYLKKYTEKHLKAFLEGKGRSAVFTQVESSPIVGAAIGALSI